MKHLFTLLVLISSLSFSAQSQSNSEKKEDAESEEHEFENKDKLKEMIRDRNYPGVDQNKFGKFADEMVNYKSGQIQQLVANWSYVDASGNLNDDVGRTNTITIDTLNPGRIYVCTPHSGVWLTNDNGATYTPITESLPTQSTTNLVIDPSNTNTLYLATGIHQMDMPRNSMGVYKSTDGGSTWNVTGLSFAAASGFAIGDMIINPHNTASVLATTSDGLYRTYDSGASWTKILNDSVNSIRFKPGDTTIIYVAGPRFYRSDNGGSTFSQVINGLLNTFQWRYENYVRTVANFPDIVYFASSGLYVNPNFNPKLYVHKSTDSGLNFAILDSLSAEPCNQFDVSQQVPDKFVAGYRMTFKKESAAVPFTLFSTWYQQPGASYIHADQRGMMFDPQNDSIIYYCNDGGLYRVTNNNIVNITANMELAHLYNFASTDSVDYKILAATLDVYPYMIGNSGISQTYTQYVEAFAAHMSPLNDSVFCMSMGTPGFTVNNGNTFFNSNEFLIDNGFRKPDNFWYDECNQNVCYFASYNDIFKSTDYGLNFGFHVRTTYNPVNSFINHPKGFVVSRANPRYIYVYYIDSVFVTKDGSNNFFNISAGLPIGAAAISNLVVDPINENIAWLSFSGYSAGDKVFYTNNAGQTWTNISAGIPNIPVNMLIIQNGVPGAVYAGTDGGVFYKDDNFSSWQYYSTNLPNVIITDIDIQDNLGKLRVATFGRGVWESDLFQSTPANFMLPPVALFSSPNAHACPGENLLLNNNSCGIVDSVLWLFPGGTPATSTLNDATVSYSTSGNYTVSLIAYNAGGSDTLTLTNFISITPSIPIPYYEPIADLNSFVLPAGSYITEVNFDDATWNRGWWTDGSSGTDDDFLWYDNFFHDLNGLEERIVFPTFDLTGTIAPKLFFYRSYQRRDAATNDTLIIYVKPCGGNEIASYTKGGAQLANIPGYYSFFYWIPTLPADWQLDSLDLTPFAGQQVVISFSDKGYGGQMLYIDEFRVMETNTTGLPEENQISNISVFPNPASAIIHIRSDRPFHSPIRISDITGRLLHSIEFTGHDAAIDISDLSSGLYFMEVNGTVRRIEKQ